MMSRMECKELAEICCETLGRLAHRYPPSELAVLPKPVIERLLPYIGPLHLHLLEVELKSNGIDVYTEHVWRELFTLRWPFKHHQTPDIFAGSLACKSPRECYIDVHFKHLIRPRNSHFLPIEEEFYHLDSPLAHLTPLCELRKLKLMPRHVTPADYTTALHKSMDSYDIYFYGSQISTMVVSCSTLHGICRDKRLMDILCTSVKVLHVYMASNDNYHLLRYFLVMLQYRGLLEDVVLFHHGLSLENLTELLYIMAGHAEPNVDAMLEVDSEAFGGESEPYNPEKENEKEKAKPSRCLCGDRYRPEAPIELHVPFTVHDDSYCELCETDIEHDTVLEDDKDMEDDMEENMLYDSIYNNFGGTRDSTPQEIYPLFIDQPTHHVPPDTLQKGLKGLGLIGDKILERSSFENSLRTCFKNWPRLEKMAASDLRSLDLNNVLLELVMRNNMKSIIVQNMHFDPYRLISDIMNCKERRGPLNLLKLTNIITRTAGQAAMRSPVTMTCQHGIKELDLRGTFHRPDSVLSQYLAQDKQLRLLHMAGSMTTPESLLCGLPTCQHLDVLTLAASDMSLHKVCRILHRLPTLRSLDLSHCSGYELDRQLDAETCRKYAQTIMRHPRLVEIAWFRSPLGNTGSGFYFLEELSLADRARKVQRVDMRSIVLDEGAVLKLGEELLRRKKGDRHFMFLDKLTLTCRQHEPHRFESFRRVVRELVLKRPSL